MLEHMRSEKPIVGKMMDVINPFVVRLWGHTLIEERRLTLPLPTYKSKGRNN